MEGRAQSEFNMAVSYLNRLNALFYIADEAAIGLDIYTWCHTLMSLQRELSTEMKDKELDAMNKEATELGSKVSQSIGTANRTGKMGSVPPDVYNLLHNFEVKLRKVMKEAGLQNRMMDSAEQALK